MPKMHLQVDAFLLNQAYHMYLPVYAFPAECPESYHSSQTKADALAPICSLLRPHPMPRSGGRLLFVGQTVVLTLAENHGKYYTRLA